MQVRYIATEDPSDDETCTVFGQTFELGEWTSVSAEVAAKLEGNRTFETKGGKPVVQAPEPEKPKGDEPSVEELRSQLDDLGVKYHHAAGVPKLTELLEAATAPPAGEGAGA